VDVVAEHLVYELQDGVTKALMEVLEVQDLLVAEVELVVLVDQGQMAIIGNQQLLVV
jgi:hypothetical protein